MPTLRRRSTSISQRSPTSPRLANQAEEIPLQVVTPGAQAATLYSSKSWPPPWAEEADNMKASTIQREDAPLLLEESEEGDVDVAELSEEQAISNWQLAGLYTTHTLSMWNSRSYEFAAVLFTTSAYPHTLVIASLRGLTANLAALLFGPVVGRWCNQHPSRLRTLQFCIVFQRICIAIACCGWALIVQSSGIDRNHEDHGEDEDFKPVELKHAIVGMLLVLGMLEKLSWVGDLVVVERDWVPILANDSTKPPLHVLNANVKRIDLISKLVAPLAISGIALWLQNMKITALIIAATQLVTVGPEVCLALLVWRSSPALQMPKKRTHEHLVSLDEHNTIRKKFTIWIGLFRRYMRSPVFIPSLAWVIQPMSVLTLSASMMVYLLSINFPLKQITVGRTLSTGVEILSTILTPILISWLRRREKTRSETDPHHLQPLITVGLLGMSSQLFLLIPAVVSLLILPSLTTDPTKSFPVLTKVLLISLGLSRLGPFAFALVEQQLVQVAVPPDRRVEFSGTEMAVFSLAELLRWAMIGIFGKPEQFKAVALISFAAIAVGAVLFWRWTWNWKGRIHDSGSDEDSDSDTIVE